MRHLIRPIAVNALIVAAVCAACAALIVVAPGCKAQQRVGSAVAQPIGRAATSAAKARQSFVAIGHVAKRATADAGATGKALLGEIVRTADAGVSELDLVALELEAARSKADAEYARVQAEADAVRRQADAEVARAKEATATVERRAADQVAKAKERAGADVAKERERRAAVEASFGYRAEQKVRLWWMWAKIVVGAAVVIRILAVVLGGTAVGPALKGVAGIVEAVASAGGSLVVKLIYKLGQRAGAKAGQQS